MTYMTIARQRLGNHCLKAGIATNRGRSLFARQCFGKHILEVMQSVVGPPLLGSKSPDIDSHGNGWDDNRGTIWNGDLH
jgi:hypothetical protein